MKKENTLVVNIAKRLNGLKYGNLYHSESVFDTFYGALKRRQLIVYSGIMKDYAEKFNIGELDKYEKTNEDEYTHVLQAVWRTSKYQTILRKLTAGELGTFNNRAELIEENKKIGGLLYHLLLVGKIKGDLNYMSKCCLLRNIPVERATNN